MEKVPLTIKGHAALEEELKQRQQVDRPRIIQAISEARALGDLSENAEYHAAKEAQSLNEGRVLELESLISRAEVIDVTKLSGDRIKFGAVVRARRRGHRGREDLPDRRRPGGGCPLRARLDLLADRARPDGQDGGRYRRGDDPWRRQVLRGRGRHVPAGTQCHGRRGQGIMQVSDHVTGISRVAAASSPEWRLAMPRPSRRAFVDRHRGAAALPLAPGTVPRFSSVRGRCQRPEGERPRALRRSRAAAPYSMNCNRLLRRPDRSRGGRASWFALDERRYLDGLPGRRRRAVVGRAGMAAAEPIRSNGEALAIGAARRSPARHPQLAVLDVRTSTRARPNETGPRGRGGPASLCRAGFARELIS